MSADQKLVNISGTILNFTGSTVVSLSLLCGVSGNSVIPIKVNSSGFLITTSGA